MKHIFKIAAIIAAVMLFAGCEELENETATFIGLTANGSKSPGGTVMETTTMFTLSFDKDIDGLSAADITLSAGSTGAAKGTLTRIGFGEYRLSVTSVHANGTATVSVSKSGYDIYGGPKSVDVYYSTLVLPVGTYPAAFIGLTADGSPTEADTTILTLIFDRDIGTLSNGLDTADVTLNAGTTGAVKGDLIKGWKTGEYELSLTNVTSTGIVSVSVSKTGWQIVDGPKETYVYKFNMSHIPVTFSGVTADGSPSATTTKLTLTFVGDIESLSASDIILEAGTTGAVKGDLKRIDFGKYELSLFGITEGGQVSVSVAKAGYAVTGAPQTADVYYYYAPPVAVTFSNMTANGSATSNTTKLTLTFSADITGLTANDITLTPGSTGAVKGTLTKMAGTGVYDLSLIGITAGGTVTVSVAKAGYSISGGSKNATVYYYLQPVTTTSAVTKVTFTGNTATVTLSGLNNNDIYLVKVNTSTATVTAANTGSVSAESVIDSVPGFQRFNENLLTLEDDLPRMGHPAADEMSANPPPIVKETPGAQRSAFVPLASFSVGAAKSFWVENYYGSLNFVQKQATLMATGTYGNIWVMNENTSTGSSQNKITQTEAQTLAQKFDQIYPLETKLLGYEYGGDPSRPNYGGKDNDPKVQILVYDIVNSSGSVMAAGYFWSKDFYTNAQLGSSYKSNEAEIFYIDASQVKTVPVYIHSTLVHEFQHMINFNEKSVQRSVSSASWYNEMLSMMTEDVIGPMIGIPLDNTYHKVRVRMPTALSSYYTEGITEWNGNSVSYATKIAFGSYLMRNFGGAELLQKILKNNTVNAASITAALNEISSGMTFDQALSRYGEAMIFSGSQKPSGVLSYDNTVTKTISGSTYTVYGFNVWSDFNFKGPAILDLTQREMRPGSITIHSVGKKSGNFSITLQRPSDPNVTLYLMKK